LEVSGVTIFKLVRYFIWFGNEKHMDGCYSCQEVEILDEELGEEEVEARDTFTSSQLGIRPL
jgi:hypothetical protein